MRASTPASSAPDTIECCRHDRQRFSDDCMNLDDTIVAIATPPGRGGIGVVRLSGSESVAIAQPLLRLSHDNELQPNRAHFGELIDPATNDRIDEVVVTLF